MAPLSLKEKKIDLNMTINEYLLSKEEKIDLSLKTHKRDVGKTYKLVVDDSIVIFYRIEEIIDSSRYMVSCIRLHNQEHMYSYHVEKQTISFLKNQCKPCTKRKFEQLKSDIDNWVLWIKGVATVPEFYPQYHRVSINKGFFINIEDYDPNTKLLDIYHQIEKENLDNITKIQDQMILDRKTLIGKTFVYKKQHVDLNLYQICTVHNVGIDEDTINYYVSRTLVSEDSSTGSIRINIITPKDVPLFLTPTTHIPYAIDTDVLEEKKKTLIKKLKIK